MQGQGKVKGVVVLFDPETEELCILSSANLQVPDNALEMVRVHKSDMEALGTSELDRRVSGTVIGALEVFHKRKIRII